MSMKCFTKCLFITALMSATVFSVCIFGCNKANDPVDNESEISYYSDAFENMKVGNAVTEYFKNGENTPSIILTNHAQELNLTATDKNAVLGAYSDSRLNSLCQGEKVYYTADYNYTVNTLQANDAPIDVTTIFIASNETSSVKFFDVKHGLITYSGFASELISLQFYNGELITISSVVLAKVVRLEKSSSYENGAISTDIEEKELRYTYLSPYFENALPTYLGNPTRGNTAKGDLRLKSVDIYDGDVKITTVTF